MRKNVTATHVVAGLLGSAMLAVTGTAAADDPCPVNATTVYVAGSSAFAPVLQAVQAVLGSSVQIVYQKPGSCQGLQDVLGDSGMAVPKDITAATLLGTTAATNATCTVPGGGNKIDIGISDVYADLCKSAYDTALNPLSATQKDFLGPIQAMTIAVPKNSSENAISAEAAYMVFGFGADTAGHTIAPWTLPGDILVRYYDSGTIQMIGAAIGLPGGKWVHATDKTNAGTFTGAGPLATALATAAAGNANAPIGILGAANLTADTKALAFQAKGQTCSYYPDSSSSASDKLNVRQGRYAIWGPEHLVTNVDGAGKPVGVNGNNAAVQTLINALTATSQVPALTSGSDAGAGDGGTVSSLTEAQVGTLIDAISVKTTGVIPQCAMQVSRSSEVGPEASYAPPAACSCRFEYAATGAAVSGHVCTACTAADEATKCTGATPKCRFGYCEAE